MKCPRDGAELASVIVGGVEVDKCHKCDGIWCDRGEMDRLRDRKISEVEELLEAKYGSPTFREGKTAGHMRCPRCGEGARLTEYSVSYGRPVRIDRCEKCFGVWLDDRELNSIVEEKKKVDKVKPEGSLIALLRWIPGAFKGQE
ncbi:MAG: TFIIB-type zinc ribbon-containing protein [Thermoguttaceae bacterium]